MSRRMQYRIERPPLARLLAVGSALALAVGAGGAATWWLVARPVPQANQPPPVPTATAVPVATAVPAGSGVSCDGSGALVIGGPAVAPAAKGEAQAGGASSGQPASAGGGASGVGNVSVAPTPQTATVMVSNPDFANLPAGARPCQASFSLDGSKQTIYIHFGNTTP